MRAKKAKHLRLMAQQKTAGKPQTVYMMHKVTRNIRLQASCTRAVYQQLKRHTA